VTPGAPEAVQADPAWPTEAWRAFANEQRLYLSTAVAFTRDPRRFGAEWADGRLRALNPIGFALTGLGITGAWQVAVVRLLDAAPPNAPLWTELIKPAVPFLFPAVMSVLVHLIAKLLGSRRPLRSTVGIALFASGPMTGAMVIFAPLVALGVKHPGSVAWGLATMCGSFSMAMMYVVLTARALAGLHDIKARWAALALLVVYAALIGGVVLLIRVDPNLGRWLTF
jgi:hypothetical protein